MKWAIYTPVFRRYSNGELDEWRVRMEIVGSVDDAYSADQALRAAKAAGFVAPVVGEWKEREQ
jgi:hypothetical protein